MKRFSRQGARLHYSVSKSCTLGQFCFAKQQRRSYRTTYDLANQPELYDASDYNQAYEYLSYFQSQSVTNESVQYGKNYKPVANDIFVCTPPRSGTVWTGYIIYLLKCKCRQTSIDKIKETADFMPFLPTCYDIGFNIQEKDYKQEYEPNQFMCHLSIEDAPVNDPNAKIVSCLRDPKDAIYSWYKLFADDFEQVLNFDAFCDVHEPFNLHFMATQLEFYQTWALFYNKNNFNYKNGNVLTIFFEDLLKDRRKCIQEIESFIGINDPNGNDYDSEFEDKVFIMSSHDEMKKIKDKFNFGIVLEMFNQRRMKAITLDGQLKKEEHEKEKEKEREKLDNIDMNANTDVDVDGNDSSHYVEFKSGHIRADGGVKGQAIEQMPQKWIDKYNDYWKENIYPILGCKDYQTFRDKVSFLSK